MNRYGVRGYFYSPSVAALHDLLYTHFLVVTCFHVSLHQADKLFFVTGGGGEAAFR